MTADETNDEIVPVEPSPEFVALLAQWTYWMPSLLIPRSVLLEEMNQKHVTATEIRMRK